MLKGVGGWQGVWGRRGSGCSEEVGAWIRGLVCDSGRGCAVWLPDGGPWPA